MKSPHIHLIHTLLCSALSDSVSDKVVLFVWTGSCLTSLSKTKSRAQVLCVLLTVASVCLVSGLLWRVNGRTHTHTFHCVNWSLGLIIYLILSYTHPHCVDWIQTSVHLSHTHTDWLSPKCTQTHIHICLTLSIRQRCDTLTYKHTHFNLYFFGTISTIYTNNLQSILFWSCCMNKHILNYWWM